MALFKISLTLIRSLCMLAGCQQNSTPEQTANQPVQFVNAAYGQHFTDLTQIDPAYLFIYANHLFNNGEKDAALFWFYVAQYRALIIRVMENDNSLLPADLYQQLAEDAGTPVIGQMVVLGNGLNRGHLYNYIHSGLGIDINGYAGSNMNNWITQLEKVMAFEKANPFDPYQAVPAEQLNKEKLPEAQRRAEGLAEMIAFLKNNKAELEKQRDALKNN